MLDLQVIIMYHNVAVWPHPLSAVDNCLRLQFPTSVQFAKLIQHATLAKAYRVNKQKIAQGQLAIELIRCR